MGKPKTERVALTKGVIAAAKYDPAKPHRKLRDGGGLYLTLTPGGLKVWRLDFRWQGKAQIMTLGRWPDLDIEQARGLRSAAKAALKAGRDPRGPAPVKGDTFGAFADAHIARQRELGRSAKTVEAREWLLGVSGLARTLRPRPVASIAPLDVIGVLRPYEGREMGRKLKLAVRMVFDSAIVAGAITVNPCAAISAQDVKSPQGGHRPAIVDRDGFRGLVRSIACYRGDRCCVIRDALRLLALTALRPSELRLSTWADVDLDKRTWSIDAERMKMRRAHVIPLAQASVDILTALKARTRSETWVFPSPRDADKPLSTNALSAALTAMGYHGVHCPHGFRASFRSLAAESGRWSDAAVKLQMAHVTGDSVVQAYDRSPRWAERVALAEWWARECEHMERVARLIG